MKERYRQKLTEIERQRDRENMHASMLPSHPVFVTIKGVLLCCFLGPCYCAYYNCHECLYLLKKKLPVSLYPSSLQELLLFCLFYLIRLISLSIPKQLEVLIILVYWKVIWLEGRVWQATICSLSITYSYRCIRNLDAPIHFILLIMASLL